MADRLEESLADLAESGRRHAVPSAPERIRARGEQR
ncbi:integral membrane protein, partial [Streptomyces coelicoflavus ZG0656]